MEDPDKLVQLYDPGEVGREEHNGGDRFVVGVANVVAWLFPALMLAICTQVVLRTFGRYRDAWADTPVLANLAMIGNQAWLDDLQWWIYGFACLVGIAYAITTNSHVRVDIFYDNFDGRKKNRIDMFALGWLLMPFLVLCWDITVHYAASSVAAWEGSDSPNGLHNLWALKIAMNLCFLLMFVAAYSAFRRYLARNVEPTLWRQMLYALPTTFFLINLAIYYALYWFVRFTGGADLNPRRVTREPVFGELEIGAQEIEYTIIASTVATIAAILIARALSGRKEA
ncbi:TRAP transporter small permease subunit [Actibacterium sp. 188UL27-1]|uniref:TRAP transporter small permease subunit n=1 Tax=Actibacterium sp. 188UL27-1 TaxID=2786961 RepID=UPI00195C53D6|nr:TRAP transporter small permease subunit [Actibacterium sp. 188UL27-1]MBM7068370.1 TRAP transporter small permease subunit [Actibacterium sp. 188UL27-1]